MEFFCREKELQLIVRGYLDGPVGDIYRYRMVGGILYIDCHRIFHMYIHRGPPQFVLQLGPRKIIYAFYLGFSIREDR